MPAPNQIVLLSYHFGCSRFSRSTYKFTFFCSNSICCVLYDNCTESNSINLLCFSWWGLLTWGIQMIWIPFWAAGVVNGIGHYWGYRNVETRESSRNVFPIGIIIGGEELHNNHHADAGSAKLSRKWFEIDAGWFYIKLLEKFRLAKLSIK